MKRNIDSTLAALNTSLRESIAASFPDVEEIEEHEFAKAIFSFTVGIVIAEFNSEEAKEVLQAVVAVHTDPHPN